MRKRTLQDWSDFIDCCITKEGNTITIHTSSHNENNNDDCKDEIVMSDDLTKLVADFNEYETNAVVEPRTCFNCKWLQECHCVNPAADIADCKVSGERVPMLWEEKE